MHPTSRRQVLQGLGALAISGAAASTFSLRGWARGASPAGIRFGAQTNAWAIDPNNFDSFLAVLNQIKQIGYAGFETGFFNLEHQFDAPADARQRIAATGLDFTGIHIAISLNKIDPATKLPPAALYEKVARGGLALGAKKLILSGVPTPEATEDELKRKIDGLNAAGRFSHGLGLQFSYHNHWWEAQSKLGELEALYAQTDPAAVSFLLDAGWAHRGGVNVPEFLRRHSARITALHLRDFTADGKQVQLGGGVFPLKQVVATLHELYWQGWALNEEERSDGAKLGNAAIEPAYRALREAFSA
jgi:sugar phosphate isomerase/epimerase